MCSTWVLRTFWGPSEDLLRPFWGPSEDVLRTFWGPSEDLLRTFWGRSEALLRTFWGPSEDVLGPSEDLLRTFWGRSEDLLRTFWGRSEDVHVQAKQTAFWCYCCQLVAKSCLTLCDPMDCSLSGFPVLHHHLELAQTPVHWVGDAIQPSHPLLPAFSSCPQSFLASGSFPVSWLFPQGGQTVWKLQVTSAQLLTCLTFLTKMAVLRLKRAGTV